MPRSSRRKPSRLVFAAGFIGCAGAGAFTNDTAYRYEGRIGFHLFSPEDLAVNRHVIYVEEKMDFSELWKTRLGMRAWANGAYGENAKRYDNTAVVHNESSEIMLRDCYVQYEKNWLLARVGQQQVVWGEAFGFFYADIVNPKDLRELGLGNLADNRFPTPMMNLKGIFGDYSVQLLYIPKPFFNKMPSIGGDFAAPYAHALPDATINVYDDRTLPLAWSNGEAGVRASALVAGIDLSAFYFYYFDRTPNYHATVYSFAPLNVALDAFHARISTAGVTATTDLVPVVLRFEGIYTFGRLFDSIQSFAYLNVPSDQVTAVLEADYSNIPNWNLGLQVSHSGPIRFIPSPVFPVERDMVSLHADGTLFGGQELEVIFGYAVNDGSSVTQANYRVPVSDKVDLSLGTYFFLGNPSGQYGQFKPASRVFTTLRAFF